MCNGAAKQVSAGVAPCKMVGFVKLFRTSVARQVSRKEDPLKKQEFHRVTPLRETCFAARRYTWPANADVFPAVASLRQKNQVSAKSFNVYFNAGFTGCLSEPVTHVGSVGSSRT